MYIPKHFKMDDKEMMYDIIEANGFATLMAQHQGYPNATHLPLLLDKESGYLYGHFARANEQWQDIRNQEVLVVFQGPHCYISPSWYETDRAVPTWNYVAVHVYGQVEFVRNDELKTSLRDLVLKYEQPTSAYQFDEVDSGFLDGMAKGVVGFRIQISRMEGKAKLSQNHSDERKKRVIGQLEQSGNQNEQQIAVLMKAEGTRQVGR
ncbi:FMN-binding negative transcriptional regulator [Shouchella patagoniensis]|uniref:FMN-binding negative transcriptional regulator n=1 Tax=Shouchella patagoniensis TaxID=228576 RepID=UPI00099594F7|nr:FMN-binding negative transcriptional regulator [Shouchella patagoniensis]